METRTQIELNRLKNQIRSCKLQPNDDAYLVSKSFIREFEQCAPKNFPPGPCSNSDLLHRGKLKAGLTLAKDYIIVDRDLWEQMQIDYAAEPEIKRSLLPDGTPDLYPLILTVFCRGRSAQFSINRSFDVSSLFLRIVMEFCIGSGTKFYIYPAGSSSPLPESGMISELIQDTTQLNVVFGPSNNKPSIVRKKVEAKELPQGILNSGNTCFINALVQSLISLPEFSSLLIDNSSVPTISSILLSVVSEILESKKPFDASSLYTKLSSFVPLFGSHSQQDSHELLTQLLDHLRSTPVESAFFGQMISSIVCEQCKEKIELSEAFSSLAIPISTSRRIHFIPFDSSKPSELLFSVPSTPIVIFGLKDEEVARIDADSPSFRQVYALELPKVDKKFPALTILRTQSGAHFGDPFLTCVQLNRDISESKLFGSISERMGPFWGEASSRNDRSSWRIRTAPERFTKDKDGILCNEVIEVEVPNSYLPSDFPFYQQRRHPKVPKTSLEELISAFFSEEKLDSQNRWFCQKCNTQTCALRRYRLVKTPQYLALQLKRFSAADRLGRDNSEVGIPLKLELEKADGELEKYKLISAVCHEGTLDSGHYTAVALRGREWFLFNDSKVIALESIPDLSMNSYLLFYSK